MPSNPAHSALVHRSRYALKCRCEAAGSKCCASSGGAPKNSKIQDLIIYSGLERTGEHVRAVSGTRVIRAICLYEERQERGAAVGNALVVAEEEPACVRRDEHIEAACDVGVRAEASTTGRRCLEPHVGRQRRCVRSEERRVGKE